MKFLIFTVSCGGGHNQAAQSLKEKIEKNGDSVIVFDLFEALNSKFRKTFVEKRFEILVSKFPSLYDIGYFMSDKFSINQNDIFNKMLLSNKSNLILELVEKEKPDVIISTHAFATKLFSMLNEKNNFDFVFIQIVTDFVAHKMYFDKYVDGYIVGSEHTKQKFIENGFDPNIVRDYGIPVKEEFATNNKTKISKPNILIMGGSLGSDKIINVLNVILKSNLDLTLTVVCGKNEKLYKKIYRKFENEINNGKVILYGFTNKISEIMDNSVLLISKPGGLTVSEAINKNLPIIIPFSYPGQEKDNVHFIVDHNLGLKTNNLNELTSKIDDLLKNPDEYNKLTTNMKNISKNYSIEKIIDFAKELYENKRK